LLPGVAGAIIKMVVADVPPLIFVESALVASGSSEMKDGFTGLSC